jgi:hypothetical protein
VEEIELPVQRFLIRESVESIFGNLFSEAVTVDLYLGPKDGDDEEFVVELVEFEVDDIIKGR